MAAALLLYPVQALSVHPGRGAGLLWVAPAGPGSEFTLAWTHTVTRGPILETYRIEPDGRLHLVEMVFDQYGPNLPAGPENGTTWRIERDRWIVTGYETRLERLNLGVGPYDHRLQVGRWEWDLVAGAGPDRLVRVEAGRQPLVFIILTEVWQWRTTNRRS